VKTCDGTAGHTLTALAGHTLTALAGHMARHTPRRSPASDRLAGHPRDPHPWYARVTARASSDPATPDSGLAATRRGGQRRLPDPVGQSVTDAVESLQDGLLAGRYIGAETA